MSEEIRFDEIGPSKILEVYSPAVPFRGVVVVDNTALGAAIGGIRVSERVTGFEVARLARTMTLKSAAAGLPHGGGKSGIMVDPEHPQLERVFRTFARLIREVEEYIPAPDMGCHEDTMAWIEDEIGRVCGLPEEIGGLPLDKLGATGFGLAECAEIACQHSDIDLRGARVAIHGFGSVGQAAARFLADKGAVLVAAADSRGTVSNVDGIDVEELLKTKRESGTVIELRGAQTLRPEELFTVDCDILVPAATPDVINESNARDIKAGLILEGANIPVTRPAEKIIAERGILVVPDFVANAGGLIMAAMEYARKTEKEAFEAISTKLKTNTRRILETAHRENILPRDAAEKVARKRVLAAMRYREYTYPKP